MSKAISVFLNPTKQGGFCFFFFNPVKDWFDDLFFFLIRRYMEDPIFLVI